MIIPFIFIVPLFDGRGARAFPPVVPIGPALTGSESSSWTSTSTCCRRATALPANCRYPVSVILIHTWALLGASQRAEEELNNENN